uniref:Putative salivary kunitz domain protein n=1 Tax=Ixodes ricinus TaxID=34613 RepID=A0A0K8R6C9_IXORI
MLIEIASILATATGSYSNSCQSDTQVDVCTMDPDRGFGADRVWDFFYDWRTDKCIAMWFGENDDSEKNQFFNEDECNSKCRKNIRKQCSDDPTPHLGNDGPIKWTYNSSVSKCVSFHWQENRRSKNKFFDSEADCFEKCALPDLGLCAYQFRTNCKHGDDLYFWYNNRTQKCEILRPDYCPTHGNAFYTLRQCYQRCGRFVEDKCKLTIQNMSFCSKFENRWGYNNKNKRCEMFQGCEDSGNSFPNAKECWNTCAKQSNHRCTQEPDYSTTIGFMKRYYYVHKYSNSCKEWVILGFLVVV